MLRSRSSPRIVAHNSLDDGTMMMSTLATGAFVFFFIGGSPIGDAASVSKPVQVDLYYESLCGDSRAFVINQLKPAYESLKDYFNINFVPYGKASHTKDEKTNKWVFECQHFQAECQGNRDQACALDAIARTEKEESREELSVKLVACVMGSTSPATATDKCANRVGLTSETKNKIVECRDSSLGDELLVKHGDKTKSLPHVLTYVPTVVIDKTSYTKEFSAYPPQNPFKDKICELISANEKPSVC